MVFGDNDAVLRSITRSAARIDIADEPGATMCGS